MNNLKKIIKRIVFGYHADDKVFIKYMREKGAKIGERVMINDTRYTVIDETRPYLIEIGNDVVITRGCTILTHGYDWCVLQKKFGHPMGSIAKVKIGNNVFIGMNSTILKGVEIGDNVIIGANSLVTKNIPSNCVAYGQPCKPIMSIEEYYKKRLKLQDTEAQKQVFDYMYAFDGKIPDEEVMQEYFWLWSNDYNKLPKFEMERCNYSNELQRTKKELEKNVKHYQNYNDFISKAINSN